MASKRPQNGLKNGQVQAGRQSPQVCGSVELAKSDTPYTKPVHPLRIWLTLLRGRGGEETGTRHPIRFLVESCMRAAGTTRHSQAFRPTLAQNLAGKETPCCKSLPPRTPHPFFSSRNQESTEIPVRPTLSYTLPSPPPPSFCFNPFSLTTISGLSIPFPSTFCFFPSTHSRRVDFCLFWVIDCGEPPRTTFQIRITPSASSRDCDTATLRRLRHFVSHSLSFLTVAWSNQNERTGIHFPSFSFTTTRAGNSFHNLALLSSHPGPVSAKQKENTNT